MNGRGPLTWTFLAVTLSLFDVAGWFGMIAILGGYAYVTRFGADLRCHLINLAGSLGLGANAVHYGATPSVALNLAWAALAITGAVRAHKAPPAPAPTA